MSTPPAGDTIFALSSGTAPAAIGIVRISGPHAGRALMTLAGRMPEPRRAVVQTVHAADGEILDRCLLLWFVGPATVTGEDLAELHLHGGKATIVRVLRELGTMAGLRPAEPGEFTRRAFENGRIDLAQAEGLADLLSAETEQQRRQALGVAEGGLARKFETWRRTLLALSARIEARIEFGDDEDDVGDDPAWLDDVATLRNDIVEALAMPPAERLRDGARIIIAGPPNSGKSTLINALAGRPVSIATPIAGTTRDLIEAPVILDGMPCIFTDSAGLREPQDDVERLGIERAGRAMAGADLILWLGPPDHRPDGRVIIIASKIDCQRPTQGCDVAISAQTGEGMPALRAEIARHLRAILPVSGELLFAERQRTVMRNITEILAGMSRVDLVLQGAQIAAARYELDHFGGGAGVEDMLDGLFGRFCIGK